MLGFLPGRTFSWDIDEGSDSEAEFTPATKVRSRDAFNWGAGNGLDFL